MHEVVKKIKKMDNAQAQGNEVFQRKLEHHKKNSEDLLEKMHKKSIQTAQ